MEGDTLTPTWCPRCGEADIADTTCPRCALAIRTTAAHELRRLSTEIEARRRELAALATRQQSATQEYYRLLTEYQRVLAEVAGPAGAARPAGVPGMPTAAGLPSAPKAEFKPERVRDVLLWIGVALLAAAAVTFAAVAWTRYGAWGKGAILITATTVAGVVAHKLRIKLYATAEAVAALALVFALADWWGARQVGLGETWAGSTASTVGSLLIALFAIALFALGRLRVYRAGAVLASLYFIGSLIAMVPSPASETLALLFACASAVVVLAPAWRELRDPFECRMLLLIGAGVFWLIGLGAVMASTGHDGALVSIATASLALAPIAIRVVWSEELGDAAGQLFIGVGAFVLVLVPAVALRNFDTTTQALATALAATAAVAAANAASRIVRGGFSGAGLVGATLAGLALLPAVLSATFGPLGGPDVFSGHASDSLRSLVAHRDMINPAAIATLAVIALAMAALARVATTSSFTWLKTTTTPIAVAVATLIVPLVLVYADATVGVALGVDLALVAASIIGVATFERRRQTRISALAAIPGITVAASVLGLAMTTRPMAVTSAAITTAAFLAITMIGRAHNTRLTGGLIGGAGSWGTIALALPLTSITDFSTHLVLTEVAVATLLAGSSLRTNRPDGIGYEISGSTMAVVSLLAASADLQALVIASLVGAAGAAIVALRPDRRIVGTGAAVTLALVALWSELAVHEVHTVEAYTMPLAIALLGVGYWWRRTHREATSSWVAYGMGLAIGLFPTVLISIGNDDTLRLVLGACGAVIVLLVGAQTRLRAPIVLAAWALAVLAGDQLVNVAMQIPRWVTFAVLGALCVVLGATADRQLDNVRRIRRTLDEMQ